MGRKDMDLASKSFDNKLDLLSRYALDGLLNDVVTILVFNALENVCLKLSD